MWFPGILKGAGSPFPRVTRFQRTGLKRVGRLAFHVWVGFLESGPEVGEIRWKSITSKLPIKFDLLTRTWALKAVPSGNRGEIAFRAPFRSVWLIYVGSIMYSSQRIPRAWIPPIFGICLGGLSCWEFVEGALDHLSRAESSSSGSTHSFPAREPEPEPNMGMEPPKMVAILWVGTAKQKVLTPNKLHPQIVQFPFQSTNQRVPTPENTPPPTEKKQQPQQPSRGLRNDVGTTPCTRCSRAPSLARRRAARSSSL